MTNAHRSLSDIRKLENERRHEKHEINGILLCIYCKKRPAEHHEHKKARTNGGNNWIYNLAPACSKCNLEKHGKDYDVYLRTKGIDYPDIWMECKTISEYFIIALEMKTKKEDIIPEPEPTVVKEPPLLFYDHEIHGPIPNWLCSNCGESNNYRIKYCVCGLRERGHFIDAKGNRIHFEDEE